MLTFEQISSHFDPKLVRQNPKGILVEYLQYEFLDSLFKQAGSENLSFIGGTAIRLIYNSQRFSEDLDFDNFGLNYTHFKSLITKTCSEMQVKGFNLDFSFVKKDNTFHCYVKFNNILQQSSLTGHKDEKIFLSVDAEQKRRLFSPEIKSINKFGIFRSILSNPASILLSQKLLAILFRKREKGRDFYDTSFLGGLTSPDFDYISKTTRLTKEAFMDQLYRRCSHLNFKLLAKDVSPFLFNVGEKERVIKFDLFLKGIK